MATPYAYHPRFPYYDGAIQRSDSTEYYQNISPTTGGSMGSIQVASHADVENALLCARDAFKGWSNTPANVRSRILHRAVFLLRSRNVELAEIETADTGKPFSETSRIDVLSGADTLEYYANLVGGGGLNGEIVQLREGVWCSTTKEPLGVCVGIGAWKHVPSSL